VSWLKFVVIDVVVRSVKVWFVVPRVLILTLSVPQSDNDCWQSVIPKLSYMFVTLFLCCDIHSQKQKIERAVKQQAFLGTVL
jgi:hypothetical protein